MKISILVASLLLFISASAQHAGKVSGRIVQNAKPSDGATVSLLRAKDSVTVKLSVSNKDGYFMFSDVADGSYLVSVTAVGFEKAFSKRIEVTPHQQNIQLPETVLTPASKDLTGVTVTARRPLIENKIDRTLVNVDASITNIGTSALEVLEKSPGVTVDRDGNISLKGKEGVLVMVDGRPTQLGGADLANFLRNLNSAQLDQIEIMTNPPARYDAAGNAGVINIKTKKSTTIGYNGSVNLTYSQGRYPKTAESFNFNYREGKVNVFTNLSHNYQKRYVTLNIDRNIYNSHTDALEYVFAQENHRIMTGNSYSAKVGVDFFATKKTTFGAVINTNKRPTTITNPTTTRIFNASKSLQGVTTAMLATEGDWNSFNTNLNFRHLLDAKGKELTADIDYVKYGSTNEQFMVNSYADAGGDMLGKADTLRGHLPQDLELYSARIDFLRPLKKGARFEAGIKSGIVRTDNNAAYDSIQHGRIVFDYNRSNHFVYTENINAAYVNLNTPLSKKIAAQLGLRLENTIARGKQKTTGEHFDRNYTQLFPTAYFQYKANDKNNFGVNFGRRVSRPGYQSLNPFVRFIDRYTYQTGNPALKPSVSNNFEISHSWKNQIITTLNYTYTKDIVTQIAEQRGEETYNMLQNVASLNQIGFSVSANTPLTTWWTSNIDINVFNNTFKGVVTKAPVNLSGTAFRINGAQQFQVNKTLTAEITGMYRNGGLEGLVKVKWLGVMGVGLSQKVLKNKGTLRLTVRDIFHSQILRGSSQYGNVDFAIQQVSETRVATIGFSYSFSKGKKIAPIKRTAGSANEEQGRIEQ
ncbi:MAG TPA: TonB-dependent receptor [Flavisolibacter sp.]|jgi:hypothetical protein|nr:TonB-dependent receptor [Flavisolibacter sp.]